MKSPIEFWKHPNERKFDHTLSLKLKRNHKKMLIINKKFVCNNISKVMQFRQNIFTRKKCAINKKLVGFILLCFSSKMLFFLIFIRNTHMKVDINLFPMNKSRNENIKINTNSDDKQEIFISTFYFIFSFTR